MSSYRSWRYSPSQLFGRERVQFLSLCYFCCLIHFNISFFELIELPNHWIKISSFTQHCCLLGIDKQTQQHTSHLKYMVDINNAKSINFLHIQQHQQQATTTEHLLHKSAYLMPLITYASQSGTVTIKGANGAMCHFNFQQPLF